MELITGWEYSGIPYKLSRRRFRRKESWRGGRNKEWRNFPLKAAAATQVFVARCDGARQRLKCIHSYKSALICPNAYDSCHLHAQLGGVVLYVEKLEVVGGKKKKKEGKKKKKIATVVVPPARKTKPGYSGERQKHEKHPGAQISVSSSSPSSSSQGKKAPAAAAVAVAACFVDASSGHQGLISSDVTK